MKKNILIIGGSGFIGYHLAKACLKLSWNVSSISLHKPKKSRKLKGVNYLIIDISKKKALLKLNNYKFQYVVNLGGYVNHVNELEVKKYHFLAVKNLYEYFKLKKIKKFIQVGSSAEYGKSKMPQKETFKCRPIGIYGKYKLKASNFLLQKRRNKIFPFTILRLYQVYGPNQDQKRFLPILIKACLNKNIFYASSGIQKRDFLYISDAVEAIIKTLLSKKSDSQILNIGFGKSIQLKKIVYQVGEITNFVKPSFGKIKLRKDEALDYYPEIKKARRIIKWKPKINWQEGILKTIRYFKEENANK